MTNSCFHLGEYVIVDQSGVDGENPHQRYQVSSGEKDLPDFRIDLLRLQLFFSQTHPDSEGQNDQAVARVAEHDREEERKGDDREHRWVRLAISGNSVSVDQFLNIKIILKCTMRK